MDSKSITNETNLGQGVGRGQPKINENMKNIKNANVKMQNKKKTLFLKSGAIFSKIGGFNGWAFTKVLSASVMKMAYST